MPPPASALNTLLQAAVLAPSGDNTQPWRFVVDHAQRSILLEVDPTRDPSPMNAGQRMARISLGAALENMARTANHNAWRYEIRDDSSSGMVRFQLNTDAGPGTIDPLLALRVTNRRVYVRNELTAEALERIRPTVSDADTTRTTFLTDPEVLKALVPLIGRADALILGTKPIRNAFLSKVRFDVAPNDAVDEGLSLGSLEVSRMDRISLRLMRFLQPSDKLMQVLGARRIFAQVATRLAASASGFCVITSTGDDERADIQVGRAWQRGWLRLTEEGFATQPMMSLLVLQNLLDHHLAEILRKPDRAAARRLLEEFCTFISTLADGRPAALLRFGQAEAPTAKVRRLAPERFMRA
ncbi:nitroreductase family protein [Candidatus Laterigemmans baculatus]|uniref:nitroreductase family protein n=1 Tax=Candidatus Laterigemmans baculatus TaxID=2770505 RepID=UPI0013DAA7C7|nr:nitroreductase family protein [Candidatus Laterigemmans baculatus]